MKNEKLQTIMSAPSFTLTRLEIVDLYATKRAAFEPTFFTVVKGPNGSGKSGLLKSIKDFIGGGSHPSSIRIGAQKGYILAEFRSEVGNTISIKKTQRKTGIDIELRDENGSEITEAPQTIINMMVEAQAVDPSKLVMMKGEDLIPLLLKAMPIEFTTAEVTTAISGFTKDLNGSIPEVPVTLTLDDIALFRKRIEEERKGKNAIAKNADGTVKKLQQAMPRSADADDTDWKAEYARLSGDKQRVEGELKTTLAEIERDEAGYVAELTKERDAAISVVQQELNAAIAKLKEEAAGKSDTIRSIAEKRIAEVHAEANLAKDEQRKEKATEYDEVMARCATAKERSENQSTYVTQKAMVEEARAEYSKNAQLSESLTSVLNAIDELKRRKLQNLPVPLEVRADGVFHGEVHWDNLNTAKRVELAFMICTLKMGKAGLLFLDGAEALDTESKLALYEGAKASGLQVVTAIVEDGPLSIELAMDNGTYKKAKDVEMKPAKFDDRGQGGFDLPSTGIPENLPE